MDPHQRLLRIHNKVVQGIIPTRSELNFVDEFLFQFKKEINAMPNGRAKRNMLKQWHEAGNVFNKVNMMRMNLDIKRRRRAATQSNRTTH